MIDVYYEVDQKQLAYVEKKLGNLRKETPKVISRALNKTATNARVALAAQIRGMYTVQSGAAKSKMKIRKANYSKLEAKIEAQGEPIALIKFKTSTGKTYGVKAQVKKTSHAEPLISPRTRNKAFVAKMKSGHKGVFQRNGTWGIAERVSKYGKNHHSESIRHFPSVSVPKMVEVAYRGQGGIESGLRDKINDDLRRNLDAQIAFVLGK